jgi:hypothetical protein
MIKKNDIESKNKLWLNDKIKMNNNFFKKNEEKKIRNQNNKDQIKKNIISLIWIERWNLNK